MSFLHHYVLGGEDGRQLVEEPDVLTWAGWYEHADRVVAQTGNYEGHKRDENGWPRQGDGLWVSTVFLGLDHRYFGDGPPLVFETMVFGGEHNGLMERYGSWAAAEAGHKRWVAKVFPALAAVKGG